MLSAPSRVVWEQKQSENLMTSIGIPEPRGRPIKRTFKHGTLIHKILVKIWVEAWQRIYTCLSWLRLAYGEYSFFRRDYERQKHPPNSSILTAFRRLSRIFFSSSNHASISFDLFKACCMARTRSRASCSVSSGLSPVQQLDWNGFEAIKTSGLMLECVSGGSAEDGEELGILYVWQKTHNKSTANI